MHQFYLYQHRRVDTQQIFYVGIGMKSLRRTKGPRTEFERAYAKAKRSDFWKNITTKTDYIVEIVLQSDNQQFIKQKEIELIAFYGRRCCDPNGILVNFQPGGEDCGGPKNRNIRITQLSLANKPIKVWEQLADIEKQLNYLKTNIVKCCRNKAITAYGYKWQYTDDRSFDKVKPSCARKKNSKRCVGIKATNRITLEEILFRTNKECATYFNLHLSTVYKHVNGKTNHKTHDINYNSW